MITMRTQTRPVHYTLFIIVITALGLWILALDGHFVPGPLQDFLEYYTKRTSQAYIPFLRCRSFGLEYFVPSI